VINIDKVVKVGGSLLSSGKDYINVAERIRNEFLENGSNIILVVSALKGVTDKLIKISEGKTEELKDIEETHMRIAYEIEDREAEETVSKLLKELRAKVYSEHITQGKRSHVIQSYGEMMSSALMAGAFRAIGEKPGTVSALRGIVAKEAGGEASIDYERTSESLRNEISRLERSLSPIIIEGYIASLPDGSVVTLGRGGSDYTATAIAGVLFIEEVYMITETSGILSCDPKLVKRPKRVERLDAVEAKLAALYGVKRLHPRTLEPVEALSIPKTIIIRSITGDGTKICAENGCTSDGVKLISVREHHGEHEITVIGKNSSHEALFSIEKTEMFSLAKSLEIKSPHILQIIFSETSSISELVDRIHEKLIWGAQ